jgi:hypothetical protein
VVILRVDLVGVDESALARVNNEGENTIKVFFRPDSEFFRRVCKGKKYLIEFLRNVKKLNVN